MSPSQLEVVVKVKNQASQVLDKVQRDVDKLSDRVGKLGDKFVSIGKKMTVASLAIVAGMGKAAMSFSDLNETISKTDVVFGNNAEGIKKWSETAATSLGLSQRAALQSASLFGDMAQAMDLSQQEATDMSKRLVILSSDIASFQNKRQDIVETALKGIFTGETESLKELGVVMTQAQLSAFALSKGIKTNIKDMSQAELVNLRYDFVLEKTARSHGDFERTSDGVANKIRIQRARVEDLSASFGKRLLPITEKVITIGNKVLDWFEKLSPATQDWIIKIGLVVAVAGPLILVLGGMIKAITGIITGIKGIAIAVKVLNALFLTNPMGIVLLAIVGLVVLIINKWEEFKSIIGGIVAPFKLAFNMIAGLWNSTLGKLQFTIPDWIPAIGGNKWGLPKIPLLAEGTRNFSGGMAVVGERGPELVNLPQGSNVFSNQESRAMAGNNIYGDIIVNDRQAGNDLLRMLSRNQELQLEGVIT